MPHISGPWDRPARKENTSHRFAPRSSPKPQRKERKPSTLALAIIGGGAAGLFAACRASECGLPALVLERKNKPARKLLMTGNGRCNLTKAISPAQMLADFGEPSSAFLRTALTAFPPRSVMEWFECHGLVLKQMEDRRVFPASEKSNDVVHCLVDAMRDLEVPLCLNSPVLSVRKCDAMFEVQTQNFSVLAKNILIATGGVSYPKTGSVGDGQRFSETFGHKIETLRAGLSGFVFAHSWVKANAGRTIPKTLCRVIANTEVVCETSGQLDCLDWGLAGAAAYNASRIVSRLQLRNFTLEWQADGEKFSVRNPSLRPLKESIVTIGGVSLDEIDPATMQSRIVPGLFFAGEVMDVDGPTGGYNLSAAFATAELAVRSAGALQ